MGYFLNVKILGYDNIRFFKISPGVCILMYLSSAKSFTRNDSLKSFSKVHVENGVNNRVESGVDIAQPSDKTNQL